MSLNDAPVLFGFIGFFALVFGIPSWLVIGAARRGNYFFHRGEPMEKKKSREA